MPLNQQSSIEKEERKAKIFLNRLKIASLVVLGLLMLIFFIYSIRAENEKIARSVRAVRETQINKVMVDRSPDRGALYYARDSFVDSGSPLIGDMHSTTLWIPYIPAKGHKYHYTLGGLRRPHELSKEANNDTIVVHKDGYELKFLIVNYE